MKIHFLSAAGAWRTINLDGFSWLDEVTCGRFVDPAQASVDHPSVTCKNCLRLIEKRDSERRTNEKDEV